MLHLAGDELDEIGGRFNGMVERLRERETLRAAMGSYIAPAIAERVLTEGAHISGEAADVTVMFVDIIGFTNLAERAIPEEVVSDLNDFFDVVVPAIERNGGHANKLLGDGLMAVFGVPTALDDHAEQSLAAAREIQSGLTERYEGLLRAGVGLNSGTVVVGSIGGGAKLDYTIIGDAVNVAARVEAHARATGDSILLTEATRVLLTAPVLMSRGSHVLKGRTDCRRTLGRLGLRVLAELVAHHAADLADRGPRLERRADRCIRLPSPCAVVREVLEPRVDLRLVAVGLELLQPLDLLVLGLRVDAEDLDVATRRRSRTRSRRPRCPA